ncbi:NAD kinase [Dermabacteraceae bacterium P13101]
MAARFLLFAHTGRRQALEALGKVVDELCARGVQAAILDSQADAIIGNPESPAELVRAMSDGRVLRVNPNDAGRGSDLVLVLGGDGTILRASEIARNHDVPLHGVNLGHVGFLAESEAEELSCTVERLLAGEHQIDARATLEVNVYDAQRRFVGSSWALNEAALEKLERQHMVNVAIEIDRRPVSAFGCDAVLLATSTGSTAYAFSAGGPVIWPEVEALTVIPLAAHALFARPLVLGKSSTVAVELSEDNRHGAALTLDGARCLPVAPGGRVEAKISDRPVRFARLNMAPFADRLVSKFKLPVEGWRGRG